MKKLVCVILVLTLLNALSVPVARAEESVRGLTLMIYMCGSNLESEYGSATADIQEMLASGYDAKQTSVLVMAGGAAGWSYAFDPAELSISELTPRGARIVWSESAQNMGAPETLTRLLTFGVENYPAREYALILWDHGGGPLEGVCWDELFSMDNLSLSELSRGIEDAAMPGKLKWIGFDACLMCSAEVASAMSPYAEYMIASQETEPAKGWNYAFLNGIENDATGADTGRRIVDCYFEGLSDSQDILTMTCVDLSKIDTVIGEMDAFFSPISDDLDEEMFAKLSGMRLAATGFGKAVKGVGEDGYDLVDLGDLISRYDADGAALESALGEAVVYSRSNEAGAGGLSVYHPYSNKEKYLRSWHGDYKALDFSSGYTRYTERFGALLTGEVLADWSGLLTEYSGPDENGVHGLSLQLSDAQFSEFASAQLMILENPDSTPSADDLSLSPVSVEPVTLDADGRISADYAGRALYVVDEEGKVLTGPVSFLLTDDGEYYLVLTHYEYYSDRSRWADEMFVLHYCALDEETNDLNIIRSYVYDWASETYTNRIGFDEAEFSYVGFRDFLRDFPETEGALPAFADWPGYGGYLERVLDLPAEWRLHFMTNLEPNDLYAMFQVTDLQQNTYSSAPVPLVNLNETPLTITPSETEFPGGMLRVSGVANRSPLHPGVRLYTEFENTSDVKMSFDSTKFVLNGSRMTSRGLSAYLDPGEVDSRVIYLESEDLFDLEEITSIECILSAREAGNYEDEPTEIPLSFEISGCDVSEFAGEAVSPLSEAVADGITWQLISLEQESDGELAGVLHVRNDTDDELRTDGEVLINGLRCDDSFDANVYAHTDAYIDFTMNDRAKINMWSLTVTDSRRLYLLGLTELLERAGETAVERVELSLGQNDIYGCDGTHVYFDLESPIPLAGAGADAPLTAPILEGRVSAAVETVLVADDGIGLGVWIENDTDEFVCLDFADPEVNGVAFGEFDPPDRVVLPAHTRAVKCFSLGTDSAFAVGDEISELSFAFMSGNQVSERAVIRFPEGTALGAASGTYLDAPELAVTPAVFEDLPMVIAETPVMPSGTVRPIVLTAPLSDAEKSRVTYISANICLLDHEIVNGDEYLTSRIILAANMEADEDGNWHAELSGLALRLGGQLQKLFEQKLDDGGIQLECRSGVYFFRDAETFRPTGDGMWRDRQFNVFAPEINFTLDVSQNTIELTESRVRLSDYDDWASGRTNFYLNEFELAVCVRRVYFGTDRFANMDTLDYNEAVSLPLDDTLALELVPIDEIDGCLGVYYYVEYEDGTCADRIVHLRTGEILESNMPEKQHTREMIKEAL